MGDPLHFLLPAALIFVLAGMVKGALGLGLPTVAVGFLSLIMSPVQAAALLVVPTLVTNVWQLVTGPRLGVIVRRLWPLLAATVAGCWISAFAFPGASVKLTMAVLGLALLVYGSVGLLKLPLSVAPRTERWAGPLTGLITGLMGGIAGNFAVPAVPYFGALDLEPDEMVQTLGLFFTVAALALAAALSVHGTFTLNVAGNSILALIPSLAGMMIGTWARSRVQPATFRTIFFIGLLFLGADVEVRSLL